MKKERLFLILSVIGILLLLTLLNFQKPILVGKISNLNIHEDKINIKLENHSEIIIFFNRTKTNFKTSDIVEIYGTKQHSLNSTTIFPDKIIKK